MKNLWDEAVWRCCATLTPVDAEGAIDSARLAAHCTWLASQGIDGVALFGTTGEGPAFTVAERLTATEAVLRAGYPAERIALGIGSAALGDMVALAKGAARLGLAAVLATPPFYFRDATDEGLFLAYARLAEQSAGRCPPILLYHIPPFTGLPLGLELVARLKREFPQLIRGLKDSGGDREHTLALLERFPDFTILGGIERHLPEIMARGARGTICGWANIAPRLILRLLEGDDAALPTLAELEKRIEGRPFLPAFKAMTAERLSDPMWRVPLPPLTAAPQTAFEPVLED
jgi:4-hydroxy-tetrahydrodipicolinate synthase